MANIPLWVENRFLLNITCCSVLHYMFGLCCMEVVALTLHEVVFRSILSPAGENASLSWVTHRYFDSLLEHVYTPWWREALWEEKVSHPTCKTMKQPGLKKGPWLNSEFTSLIIKQEHTTSYGSLILTLYFPWVTKTEWEWKQREISISNGSGTEWSQICSVIIQVINKSNDLKVWVRFVN